MAGRDIHGVPATGRPLGRGWSILTEALAALGTVLIGVLMVIICADVVARNLLGASLPVVSELGALTLVMIVYLPLATTIRHDRLARADMFYGVLGRRRPRIAALLDAAFDLTGVVMLTLIALASVHVFRGDFGRGEFIGVPGVMTLPTWPFRLLIVLGVAVAAVQFLIRFVRSLRTALGDLPR